MQVADRNPEPRAAVPQLVGTAVLLVDRTERFLEGDVT